MNQLRQLSFFDPDFDPNKPRRPILIRWRCPNCGQSLFTIYNEHPPETCHYCQDMTTWKRIWD